MRLTVEKLILSDLSSKGQALNYRPKVMGQTSFLTKQLSLVRKLLYLEFRNLFSNKIATLPARLDVREQEWEISANRTPVRPQSSRKEIQIKKALDEMLSLGIIEPSNAVYYSHPVVVQKTADTYRFCIDYRLLKGIHMLCRHIPLY